MAAARPGINAASGDAPPGGNCSAAAASPPGGINAASGDGPPGGICGAPPGGINAASGDGTPGGICLASASLPYGVEPSAAPTQLTSQVLASIRGGALGVSRPQLCGHKETLVWVRS